MPYEEVSHYEVIWNPTTKKHIVAVTLPSHPDPIPLNIANDAELLLALLMLTNPKVKADKDTGDIIVTT